MNELNQKSNIIEELEADIEGLNQKLKDYQMKSKKTQLQ